MPIGNWNLQWLNHNSQRSYPLTERATKKDLSGGTIRIPDSFIVGIYFPVHAGLDVQIDQFFVKNILLSPIGYTIGFGYNAETGPELVGNANIPLATHAPNTAYAIGGINDFADSIGHVVIGRLDEIQELPQGFYEFDIAGAEIEPDAIRPMIRGVAGIRVASVAELSETLYGDIEFVAGTNMQIDVDAEKNQITFNAISGENLNTTCDCLVNPPGECIRCINGNCSDGEFVISGGDCIQVDTSGNRILLTDTCASPCCGCAELDALKSQIDRFSDGVATLENFVTRLSSEVTQMSLVVIGSRLGDAGCDNCDPAPTDSSASGG
jgi:hypothetical protein